MVSSLWCDVIIVAWCHHCGVIIVVWCYHCGVVSSLWCDVIIVVWCDHCGVIVVVWCVWCDACPCHVLGMMSIANLSTSWPQLTRVSGQTKPGEWSFQPPVLSASVFILSLVPYV